MSDSKSKKAIEIQNLIGRVLFEDWDPIGVNNNPNLSDEYDSYIAPVYKILSGSRSEDELIDYLFKTTNETIGLDCKDREMLRPVAQKLLTLDVKL
jgi:hypothetical protein